MCDCERHILTLELMSYVQKGQDSRGKEKEKEKKN